MKTTIDIPEKVLKEAMRHTKSSNRREAILKAIEEYNRHERLSRLADEMGKSDTFMSIEELMEMRGRKVGVMSEPASTHRHVDVGFRHAKIG